MDKMKKRIEPEREIPFFRFEKIAMRMGREAENSVTFEIMQNISVRARAYAYTFTEKNEKKKTNKLPEVVSIYCVAQLDAHMFAHATPVTREHCVYFRSTQETCVVSRILLRATI